MEQHVRVLSVRDGKEWLLPMRAGAQRIQVAALKRLVLEQQTRTDATAGVDKSKKSRRRQQRRDDDDSEHKSEANDDDEASDASDSSSSESFVMFRGRILADMDHFNLHTLTPTDFFVFAHEPSASDSDDENDDIARADASDRPTSHKRKRSQSDANGTMSSLQHTMVAQLVEMGFVAAQARVAVQQSSDDLATAIAILTGDTRVLAMRSASNRTTALLRTHPQLRVLEPAVTELSDLDVPRLAARDVFQAIMRVKEHVPDDVLAPLVANPCAAVEFFRLPPPKASTSAKPQPETPMREDGSREDLAIDLASESPPAEVTTDLSNPCDVDTATDDLLAIERVRLCSRLLETRASRSHSC